MISHEAASETFARPGEVSGTVEYSVVVPVYESGALLRELFERLRGVFETTLRASWELILVDDGSQGATWSLVRHLAESEREVAAFRLSRNYGKAGAVLCGLEQARGRWVVTLDDDLQQRPEDIPAMVELRDHDVVVAHYPHREIGWGQALTSWGKSRFDSLILGLPCRMSPLKLFKIEVARAMIEQRSHRPFIPALMANVTTDFVSVVAQHDPSRVGPSRYNSLRRLRQFSNLLIGHSNFPLRALGVLGGVLCVLSLSWGFSRSSVGMHRLDSGAAESSLPLVLFTLMIGLLLVGLALVGESLFWLVEAAGGKPAFVMREAAGSSSDQQRDPGSSLAQSLESFFVSSTRLSPENPPLFVVGPPRSGTTLVFLHLLNHLRFGFIPNASKQHPQRPITEALRVRNRPFRATLENHYGILQGDGAPSDGWDIFHRFFPKYDLGKSVRHDDLFMLRNIFSLLERLQGAPLLVKNISASIWIRELRQTFPGCRFIWISREPVDTVRSLLKARRDHGTAPNHWWCTPPPKFFDRSFDSELQRVLYQVLDINRAIAEGLDEAPRDDWIRITYAEFCRHPAGLLEWAIDRYPQLELRESPVEQPVDFQPRVVSVQDQDELLSVHRLTREYEQEIAC